MQTEMFMMVTGKMIKQMAMAFSLTLIMQDMKVTGQMINNTVRVLKHGEIKMDHKQHTLETFLKERKMVKESFNGRMDHIMRAILQMDTFKDLGDIILQILTNIMKVNLE